MNAHFIGDNLPQQERLVKMNTIAIHQMKLLTDDTGIGEDREGCVAGNERGVRVAGYLTDLPPRELPGQKLKAAVAIARERLAGLDAGVGDT